MDRDLRVVLGLLISSATNIVMMEPKLALVAVNISIELLKEVLDITEFTPSQLERLVEEADQYVKERLDGLQ